MGDKEKRFYLALFTFIFTTFMGIVGLNVGQTIFSNRYLGIIMAIAAVGTVIVYTIEKKR